MFNFYKKSEKVIDHSSIDIEEEINKFLNRGGEIQQVEYDSSTIRYNRKNINKKYSKEQNSNELT